ncbi:MAG TPA: hypothetical protein VGM54_02110 [Chthoniobacter sp.]|jgi:hypothetical protein
MDAHDLPVIPDIFPDSDSLPLPATAGDDARAALGQQADPAETDPQLLGGAVPVARMMEITEQACKRIDDCRSEMGLHFGQPLAGEWTWAWERQIARIMYQGNMEHRRALGGVFLDNNWSMNIPSRIVRMLAAQHSGDLVGSDPFCAVMPEKVDDAEDEKLSKQVEKMVQEKIAGSSARQVLAESIRVALVEGERPVKITWELDKTQFVGDAVVLVRRAGGGRGQVGGLGFEQSGFADFGLSDNQTIGQSDDPMLGGDDASASDGLPVSLSDGLGGPGGPCGPDGPAGQPWEPVRTPSGDYIFPKDEFIRFYVGQDGKPMGVVPPGGDDPQARPAGVAGIQLRLRKEPAFVLDAAALGGEEKPTYRLMKNLPQILTHQRGLNVAGLFCEDFLYPIKCPSLTDPGCDIMVHCYDEPQENIEARYRNAGYADKYGKLKAAPAETGPLSQQNMPIREAGEYQLWSTSRKLVNVHETYYRCRVNEDDEHESWLFVVIDFLRRVPIYAEYLGNLKMKRPPFVLLRGVESEPGRAYGVGVYKKFADKNLAIDVWFNRAALKSSKTGSLTFQHEDGWKAEYQGQQLVIGGTEVYKIPANASEQYGPNHPPVFRVNLNEMSDKEFELMEKLIQDGDLSFGVVNAADGAAANLNASGTATGVRNIERTGNILQRATEELMATDLEEILDLITDTVLENMDEEMVQWVPGEEQLAMLSREEIRNLPRDVRVLLTKAKGEENLTINQQASQIVEDYYSKPLWLRKKIRSFVVQQLKSLFIPDADQVIEEPTDAEVQAEQQSQQSQAQPKETLNIALKDIGPLSPNERAQALALFGIQADGGGQAGDGGQAQPGGGQGQAGGAAPNGGGQ